MKKKTEGVSRIFFSSTFWVMVLCCIVYALSHFTFLTRLPIFADEAIYIRWSQLIIDNWQQYLFFPLNDGKTPLQIWLMVPLLRFIPDQLWAARSLAVAIGLVQILVLGFLTKLLGGSQKASWLSMIFGIFLPFWFFHHRIALIDALLTLLISLSLASIIVYQRQPTETSKRAIFALIGISVSFGLALLTKMTALILLPALSLWSLYAVNLSKKNWWLKPVLINIALVSGSFFLVLLKFHPAFGQLFSRGSDFLYPVSWVIFEGGWWRNVLASHRFFQAIVLYLTVPVILMVIAGLFAPLQQKRQHFLVLSSFLFLLPIIIFGKVVYPRYFLPVSLFLTLAAALSADSYFKSAKESSQFIRQAATSFVLALLIGQALATSAVFMYHSFHDPSQLTLTKLDQEQYLYEWSAGYGITQTNELISQIAQEKTVAVATEGSFGTLPDGLLAYFHNRDVTNIYIEGIGQPVVSIPQFFTQRAQTFDQTLLVVNEHRLELKHPSMKLIAEYCRPQGAPCLQVWDITELVKTTN